MGGLTTFRIRHQDGRWLKECELTGWFNQPVEIPAGATVNVQPDGWTLVPVWDRWGVMTFQTRQEAETLAAMLNERGFPCEMVEF